MNRVLLQKTLAPGSSSLRRCFLLFVLGLCANSLSLHAQTAAEREKANSRLDDFRSAYGKGVRGENREQMLDYFDAGVRLMPEFQLTIMGKRDTASYYATFSSRFQVDDYKREVKERFDIGPRVVEIGTFSMKLVLRSTRREYRLEGKYLDLWRRSEAGGLTVVAQAWNYSHPVEYSEQLKFPEVPAVNIAFQPHLTINSRIRFEIAALNELLVAVVSHHDARIWSQFYADDGMFIYSGNPIYAGRKAIDEFLEKHAAAMPIFEKLDCRNDRIDDFGNYVIEYASHIANWRNGDSSGVNTGKAITIWRREKEGSLKIFRGIAMYD